MAQWEYRTQLVRANKPIWFRQGEMWVSDTPLPEFMNELGREGWELVSKTVEYESVQGYPVYELTFKRHIPD